MSDPVDMKEEVCLAGRGEAG